MRNKRVGGVKIVSNHTLGLVGIAGWRSSWNWVFVTLWNRVVETELVDCSDQRPSFRRGSYLSAQRFSTRPCCNLRPFTMRPKQPLSRHSSARHEHGSTGVESLNLNWWWLWVWYSVMCHRFLWFNDSFRRGIMGADTWLKQVHGECYFCQGKMQNSELQQLQRTTWTTTLSTLSPVRHFTELWPRAASPVISPRWWRTRIRPSRNSQEACRAQRRHVDDLSFVCWRPQVLRASSRETRHWRHWCWIWHGSMAAWHIGSRCQVTYLKGFGKLTGPNSAPGRSSLCRVVECVFGAFQCFSLVFLKNIFFIGVLQKWVSWFMHFQSFCQGDCEIKWWWGGDHHS